MLKNLLTVIGFAFVVFWVAPKVLIDPQPIKITDDDIIIPSNDVERISWNEAERKFENMFTAPKSFAYDAKRNTIYTGTSDGMIWMIASFTHASRFIRIGDDHPYCGSLEVAKTCGRVLGLKYLPSDRLIVSDAYRGIINVNPTTGGKEILVAPNTNKISQSLKVFSSIDVSQDQIIYFTVSSMKWTYDEYIYSILEGDSTGRVYSYNLQTNELIIIASNLSYPKGLILMQNDTSLLVSESFTRRILKFDLLNTKSNPTVFIDQLPGLPDKITKDKFDNYYVAMPATDSLNLIAFLHRHPVLMHISAWFLPKWLFLKMSSFNSQIYKLNNQGRVIAIIDGTKPGTEYITEAYIVDDNIILGNSINSHLDIIKIKMNK